MKKRKETPKNTMIKNGREYSLPDLKPLGHSISKPGIKKGSDSLTHFSALSSKVQPEDPSNSTKVGLASVFRGYNSSFIALIQFLEASGARISEVLSIKWSDITAEGRVVVRSGKGSNSVFVMAGGYSLYLEKCRVNKVNPFDQFDRFYVYRELKKKGVSTHFGDNKNASVTHLFRHNAVLDMKTVDPGLEIVKQSLGHKSIKSTEAYGKGKRK